MILGSGLSLPLATIREIFQFIVFSPRQLIYFLFTVLQALILRLLCLRKGKGLENMFIILSLLTHSLFPFSFFECHFQLWSRQVYRRNTRSHCWRSESILSTKDSLLSRRGSTDTSGCGLYPWLKGFYLQDMETRTMSKWWTEPEVIFNCFLRWDKKDFFFFLFCCKIMDTFFSLAAKDFVGLWNGYPSIVQEYVFWPLITPPMNTFGVLVGNVKSHVLI